jgi:anhydro-N-acetylmuramic acid kinase
MSGTSYDAIDAVAVDVWFAGPTEIHSRIIGHHATPMPAPIRTALAAALPPAATSAADICRLDTGLGQAFAEAASSALDRFCDGTADLVVTSGQTFYHWVDGSSCLGTLQLGEPTWIAERTGLPVVSNLRTRDVTCGGQGAPLVSLVDALLLGSRDRCGALNIGGIANLTVVGVAPIAYDVGPGNALLDAAVTVVSGGTEAMDVDGARARRGTVIPALLDLLLRDPFFALPPPKSTGKERFHLDYLLGALVEVGLDLRVHADDVIATLTRLTSSAIAAECRRYDLAELVVSGGGADNPVLMEELAAALPNVAIRRIDSFGVASSAKEAFAFAVLGFLTMHGLPATLPSCTGAERPAILGSITPGRGPLQLPQPAATMPHRLSVR